MNSTRGSIVMQKRLKNSILLYLTDVKLGIFISLILILFRFVLYNSKKVLPLQSYLVKNEK